MKRKILLVFFGISLMFAGLALYASRQVRATPDERASTLAGDDLIPRPIGSVNHSITIRRLLVTCGRGWPRWVPTGPEATLTTLLITVGTPVPNASCPTFKTSTSGVYCGRLYCRWRKGLDEKTV
jgi:hypothetical protein